MEILKFLADMDEVIGITTAVVEKIREIAKCISSDPSVSNRDLPSHLEDLAQQYIELSESGERMPHVQVPMELIKLVDEGKHPSAFAEQQLREAFAQSRATAMSTHALKVLCDDLLKITNTTNETKGAFSRSTSLPFSPAATNASDTTKD
eukprot:gene5358-7109_t